LQTDVEPSFEAIRDKVIQVRNEILKHEDDQDQFEEVKKHPQKNLSKIEEESSASDDGISSMAPSSQSTRSSSR